tara:strand:+ start:86 stop:934 length:849 start_codon:yes stop_codon:yes gene_type:complete
MDAPVGTLAASVVPNAMDLDSATKIVAIEGGIGVGKSTVIDRLKELFKDNPNVIVLPEPVDEWESRGFLARMYAGHVDPGAFQHMVLMGLAGDLLEALRSRPALIITERSPFGNYHVFGKAHLDDVSKDMYEYSWERVLRSVSHLDTKFVWLTADVQMLRERIRARGRSAESGIKDEYLSKLETLHEEWFQGMDASKFAKIDASLGKEEVWKRVCNVLEGFSREAKSALCKLRDEDDDGLTRKRKLDRMIDGAESAVDALGQQSPIDNPLAPPMQRQCSASS